jgi:hypothetical protein
VAELVHGFALGALGQALIAQAEEAVHASRARRRASTCRYPSRSDLGLGECTKPEGHTGRHNHTPTPTEN